MDYTAEQNKEITKIIEGLATQYGLEGMDRACLWALCYDYLLTCPTLDQLTEYANHNAYIMNVEPE